MRTRPTDRSIWSRSGLIYAGLVALIIAAALIARAAGILPLRDAPLSLQSAHDHVQLLPYPWKRS